MFDKFARDALGETRYDWLMRRHNQVVKYTRAELEDMYQHYKAQLVYMERRRKEGELGYLDFVSWD
jgi:hypothetical protein